MKTHKCGVCHKLISNNDWWTSVRYTTGWKSLCRDHFNAYKLKEFADKKAKSVLNYQLNKNV